MKAKKHYKLILAIMIPVILGSLFAFELKPGQTVALAGCSGAGKTTCVNPLLRYWEPISGHVLIDDKELSSLSLSSFRSCIAAVLQDVFLFNTSIMDNIRLALLRRADTKDSDRESTSQGPVCSDP